MKTENASLSTAGLRLQILSDNKISIEYLYAYSMGDSANVVLKPDQLELCIKVLQAHQMDLVKASELYKIWCTILYQKESPDQSSTEIHYQIKKFPVL